MNLYGNIRQGLKKQYSSEPKGNVARHLNTLTSFVYGILKSRHVTLSEVASEIPNAGKEESKVKQLKRWISNERIEFKVYFLPFIQALLQSLAHQTLLLVIDGSVVGRGCVTLMVSLVYKNRTLPLIWVTRKGKKGHFPENIHVELIEAVHDLIPEGTDVVVLGDGEFDGTNWLSTIKSFDWNYVCRTAKDSVFYEEGEHFNIQDICPKRGGCTAISDLEFTKKRYSTATAIAWWGKKYKEPIYLVTSFDTAGEACHYYRKRFRIETLFSDHKSRGFNLHKSHLTDPERISRLMIATSLAYIWLVYLGEYAMQTAWNKIIHRTERCDLSLFKLGGRLLKRFLREGISIPCFNFLLLDNALL